MCIYSIGIYIYVHIHENMSINKNAVLFFKYFIYCSRHFTFEPLLLCKIHIKILFRWYGHCALISSAFAFQFSKEPVSEWTGVWLKVERGIKGSSPVFIFPNWAQCLKMQISALCMERGRLYFLTSKGCLREDTLRSRTLHLQHRRTFEDRTEVSAADDL